MLFFPTALFFVSNLPKIVNISNFLLNFPFTLSNFLKMSPTDSNSPPNPGKLTHALLNNFEKYAKLMHFWKFLEIFWNFGTIFGSRVAPPPPHPTTLPTKGSPYQARSVLRRWWLLYLFSVYWLNADGLNADEEYMLIKQTKAVNVFTSFGNWTAKTFLLNREGFCTKLFLSFRGK